MNAQEKGKILSKISVFVLLLMSACVPAAATAVPVALEKPPSEVLPTITTAPTMIAEPTLEPTSILAEEQVYPYFLPLVTNLDNVSQTIDGVTVKINWAYADEARMAVGYTISGLNWPEGSHMQPTQQVQIRLPILANVRLGGFSGASGGNNSLVQDGVITGSSDQSLLDGVWDAEKYPNANMVVDIPVEGPTKVGTFHFNLTIPVLNGSRIDNIDQTVVANNISMTLQSLALNPSRVDAVLCFQLPSSMGWGPYTARTHYWRKGISIIRWWSAP